MPDKTLKEMLEEARRLTDIGIEKMEAITELEWLQTPMSVKEYIWSLRDLTLCVVDVVNNSAPNIGDNPKI